MLCTNLRSIGRRFEARYCSRRCLAVGQRRAPFAGPYEGVQSDAFRAPGIALREERDTQRARGGAVEHRARVVGDARHVLGCSRDVVRAGRYVGVDRTALVGPAVTFAVDAPGVVAKAREPVHHRVLGLARHLQIEHRRPGHRRAVHEENGAASRAARSRIAQFLAQQEETNAVAPDALDRPVLGADDLRRCARRGLRRLRDRRLRVKRGDRQTRCTRREESAAPFSGTAGPYQRLVHRRILLERQRGSRAVVARAPST